MTKQLSFDLMSHEGYRKCWDDLMILRGKITQAEKEASELQTEGKPESVKSQRERQVQAVLSGVEPDEIKPIEQWRANLSKANQRIHLLKEAEREQVRRLEQERLKASGSVCEAIRPRYAEIVREIAKRLTALGEIILEEQAIRESLNDGQIAYQAHNLLPHPFLSPGSPLDYGSRLCYWLREAVRLGYIDIEGIPKEWRESWHSRNGWKFEGDQLKSTPPISEAEYAKNLRKGKNTVTSVLEKAQKVEKEAKVPEGEWSTEA